MICLDVLNMFEQYAYVNIHTPTYSFLLSFSAWFLSGRCGSRSFFCISIWHNDVLNMLDFCFISKLSGATIFPLCVRMPRIIRRGADCLREIAGHWFFMVFWSFLPFQIFFFFVSFVLDDVDRLSVKHCPNEGLTSQRDTHSRQRRLTITVSSRDLQKTKALDLNKFNKTWTW